MEDIGKTTWHEANEHCARMGKTLLAIESEEENNAIKNFLLENEGKLNILASISQINLHQIDMFEITEAFELCCFGKHRLPLVNNDSSK